MDDGQFDDPTEDAPEFTHNAHPREDLQWSDASSEESEVCVEDNVDDEDWEIAERGMMATPCSKFPFPVNTCLDFTKQYNRLRQHVAVRSGNAESQVAPSSGPPGRSVPLPAVNRHRPPSQPMTDQLAALSKYAARIAHIDQPYGQMGIATSRKDPSERANMKDKSDRATNEQVLDPRTRIILFKMIGRGLISEVNGVVSTGKEVSIHL